MDDQCSLGGHLGPQEPAEFTSDGSDDDVARGLAFGQSAELGAQVELGVPSSGDGVGRTALLTLFDRTVCGSTVPSSDADNIDEIAEPGKVVGIAGIKREAIGVSSRGDE
jgi:hypothetical protein